MILDIDVGCYIGSHWPWPSQPVLVLMCVCTWLMSLIKMVCTPFWKGVYSKGKLYTSEDCVHIRTLASLEGLLSCTRGPWWSYITHLTKQICIFTVEVSAKFTALGFLYKLYSTNHPHSPPPHPWPCFFTNLDDLNWILKEPYALTAMFFDESWQLEQTW